MEPCDCIQTNPSIALLDCNGKRVNDTMADAIFNNYLAARNVTPFHSLDLPKNRLTRVPTHLKFLPRVDIIHLYENDIRTIQYGDFNFTSALHNLGLENNNLTLIEPGAFQGINSINCKLRTSPFSIIFKNYMFYLTGNYSLPNSASIISLANNDLRRFEFYVFQSVL